MYDISDSEGDVDGADDKADGEGDFVGMVFDDDAAVDLVFWAGPITCSKLDM